MTQNSARERRQLLRNRITQVSQSDEFDLLALDIFSYQYDYNALFRQYCDLIGRPPDKVTRVREIPFLPISFFRSHRVATGDVQGAMVFESSATTGAVPSRHCVADLDLYDEVARRGFQHAFGRSPSDFRWLALLPSYLERPNSSLVHMVARFIETGGGMFFLDDLEALETELRRPADPGRPVILIGVAFALVDFVGRDTMQAVDIQVIETGGMKGRGAEMTRSQLHRILRNGFSGNIGSEYGMTELLSQAWAVNGGHLQMAPSMRVVIRDVTDPLCLLETGRRGGVNIIDLANIDSCSFVATDDVGVVHDDGSFEILGRLDGSEQRGCNLMYTEATQVQ